jgi:hypothetical protein
MKKIFFFINLLFFSIYAIHLSAADAEAYRNERGVFHIRNQFPINLQFFSFFADIPDITALNRVNLSIQYTHSNTFAMSDKRSGTFVPAGERYKYIPYNTSPGNEYYFDTASGVVNVNLKYGLSKTIELSFDIPLITYPHGFLDTPIEFFHNTFGYANYKRSYILKNQSDLYIKSDSKNYYQTGGCALGDISISAKTALYHNRKNNFAVSLAGAVKLPTGNYKMMTGSGYIDFGFELLTKNQWNNHFIFNNISIVIPNKWKLFTSINPKNIYTWVIGYEYYHNKTWSFIIQHRLQASPLDKQCFPLAAKPAFEVTAGVKADLLQKFRISFAVIQNYINHENVPDFGFHAGIALSL